MVLTAKEEEKDLEGRIGEERVKKGIDPADNSERIFAEKYMLSAEPVEAGQSAEVRVLESIQAQSKGEVDRIVLYEDGKEIASQGGFFLSHEIRKQEEGTHEYHAELYKGTGESISTDTVRVSFSGQIKDFLPYVKTFLPSTTEAGKAANIIVEGDDIGDNKGIRRITLFEDGVPCHKEEQKMMVATIHHDTPETHEYHAEIEDVGGQVVETDVMRITYLGEAHPPSVHNFHARPRQAGKTTRLIVDGKDTQNNDDLQGIERIALYEDGEKLHEEEGETLLYDISREEPGTHLYHAEIRNKNGRVTESDALQVSFLGHDFPPEVRECHARYDADEGKVRVMVEGEDSKNVRDNDGIRDIALYEDGKRIAKGRGAMLIKELERADGLHTYHAVITNKSGYSVRTGDVVAGYQKRDMRRAPRMSPHMHQAKHALISGI